VISLHDHTFNGTSAETVLRMFPIMETKEDPPTSGENILQVPDELLLRPGTIPVFTIRDPRATIPANYRVLTRFGLEHGGSLPLLSMTSNLIWTRLLYNFFSAHGIEPVLIDADDLMTDREFVGRFCVRLGLDPEATIFSWPKITEKEKADMHPMQYISQSTLYESTGVDSGLAVKNRNMEAEEIAWKREFGEDADMVEECIDRAMPHYKWLFERRFR